jgi:hypothetical protein
MHNIHCKKVVAAAAGQREEEKTSLMPLAAAPIVDFTAANYVSPSFRPPNFHRYTFFCDLFFIFISNFMAAYERASPSKKHTHKVHYEAQ